MGVRQDLYQTPGFGDTVDFDHIKQHYYRVHTGINPTGIVPVGPDLSGWLAPHHREQLGGRPFGDGTPAGPGARGRGGPAVGTPLTPITSPAPARNAAGGAARAGGGLSGASGP